MTLSELAQLRLHTQRIVPPLLTKPEEVVAWLGAVQAQDFWGSLWAIGLRTASGKQEAVEQAIVNRTIVRTWPMRGTLHFVAATDVRWMLPLLTPRVMTGNARRLLALGLDSDVLIRSKDLLIRSLEGGRQLTRNALYQVLEAGGIITTGGRGLHIVSQLSQEGLLCFGAREGKQPTFVLLDEWVPPQVLSSHPLTREEALSKLAQRYFKSHGPATIRDFAWWSGLSLTEARKGLSSVESAFIKITVDNQEYWMSPELSLEPPILPKAHLLPAFDEYLVAYTDRSASLGSVPMRQLVYTGNGIFNPVVIIDGQVVATWKRTLRKDSVVITLHLLTTLNHAAQVLITDALQQYAEFIGLPAVLTQS